MTQVGCNHIFASFNLYSMKKIFIITFISILGVFKLYGQNYSISTNLVDYLALGTLNLELSYPISRNYSLNLRGEYNPFSFKSSSSDLRNKHFAISIGGRYWMWHVNSGWFLGSYIAYSKYSISGIFTKKSYEGNAIGATIGGGYAWMLARGVNLELGLGAFVGVTDYTRYSCVRCGVREKDKTKFFVTPADVLIGLNFLF